MRHAWLVLRFGIGSVARCLALSIIAASIHSAAQGATVVFPKPGPRPVTTTFPSSSCNFAQSLSSSPTSVPAGQDFVLSWCDPSYSFNLGFNPSSYTVSSYEVFYSLTGGDASFKLATVSEPAQYPSDGKIRLTVHTDQGDVGTTYFYVEAHGCQTDLAHNFQCTQDTTKFTDYASVTVTTVVSPTVSFIASPGSVNEGDPSTLTWSVQNATAVTIDNDIGAVAKSGSLSVKPLQTTTYTLTATGAKSVTATAKVLVILPSLPLQASIRAVPSSIAAGQPVTLVWTTSGAASALLDGVGVGLSASKTVTPLQTTTYTLTATNGSQNVSATRTVSVTTVPPPAIATFNTAPSSAGSGQPVTLSWSTTGATSVTIDNGVGSVAAGGSTIVNPLATTIYSLTAVGAGGSSTKTAQVVVSARPPSVLAFQGTSGVIGSTDGTSGVLFNQPAAIGLDASGNIYVVDSGNHTIRKVSPSGLTVTWLGQAGQSGFRDGFRNEALFDFTGFSGGLLVLSDGSMVIYDHSNHKRTVDPKGNVTTCKLVSCGAKLFAIGMAVDSSANFYEAESANNRILRTPKGATLAVPFSGSGVAGFTDGQGTAATFNNPRGLAIDAADNLFVGDTGNNAIRKITPAGVVTTFAKGFSFGCCGGMLALDKQGNVYAADPGSNTIKRVTAAGIVQTLVGSGAAGSSNSEGVQASFQSPNGIAIGPDGGLVVSDTGNGTIRKITPVAATVTKRRAAGK